MQPMGQDHAKELLVELGGRATSAQIRDLAKKKYPKSSLYSYVTHINLRDLEKWGEVRREGDLWILNADEA